MIRTGGDLDAGPGHLAELSEVRSAGVVEELREVLDLGGESDAPQEPVQIGVPPRARLHQHDVQDLLVDVGARGRTVLDGREAVHPQVRPLGELRERQPQDDTHRPELEARRDGSLGHLLGRVEERRVQFLLGRHPGHPPPPLGRHWPSPWCRWAQSEQTPR